MNGVRFCYVVLCHTDAPGVLRLARRIRELSPDSVVVLRHNQDDFITPAQADEVGADLLRSTGVRVAWGEWSMCRAAIEALSYAHRRHRADHYVLVSGQDHPVRDLREWEAVTASRRVDALVHQDLPPTDESWQYAWLGSHAAPRWVPRLLRRATAAVWRRVQPALKPLVLCYSSERDPRWTLGVRRLRVPYVVSKGSLWLTLSDRALVRLLARDAFDRRVRGFFSRTKVPDEMYLQTLLLSDPELQVADLPTSWVHFDHPHSWSPDWLTAEDVRTAASSGAPFARKVPEGGLELRDLADRLVAERRVAS